nr:GIY-YIG nuclease family protein [Arenibacter arenosicollis]
MECSDGSYYCGSTVDLDKRLMEHNEGRGPTIQKRGFLLN